MACWPTIDPYQLFDMNNNELLFVSRVEHNDIKQEKLCSAIEGPETFCDRCKKKGEPEMTAQLFCKKCEKKYCAKHVEVS